MPMTWWWWVSLYLVFAVGWLCSSKHCCCSPHPCEWITAYTRVSSDPTCEVWTSFSERERERASRSVYCVAVILPGMAVWWIASKSCTALHPHHESHSMARRSSPGLPWRPQAWGKLEVSLCADPLVASNSWRICCRTRTTNYLWFLCTHPEGTA